MAENDGVEGAKDDYTPINQSIPSGEETVWTDVSSLLDTACTDLRDGELIHGENFNLFAAMSALEIMDPKMDSGIVCRYYSVDEAIESGAAPVPVSLDKTGDVQCIIDIMDHLLACEATWHKGHSLAQTVFSCIYLLRPDRTSSHALLYSYCRVIRATCNAVVLAVSDARTHEEEDIFTMTYGLPLKGDGDEKCISMLHAVDETISRQLRACKAPSTKKRVLEDIEPLQANPDLEEGYCKAVLCRLRFRKHFHHAIMCMRRPQGRGFELARKHIASCLSELDCILKSAVFIRSNNVCGSCEGEIEDKTTASGCQPIGFDSTLNSRLCAPTPPRAIKILSWKKAIEYFQKLLHDLDIICSYPLDPLFEGVLSFVIEFQKFQPDLVARAHLQLLLVQDGKLYGRDPVFAVICKSAALPEVTKNHDIQKNEFVAQLGQLLITLLKILCTNAAWQRRKLGKIIQDWRIIYLQLELAFRKDFGETSSPSTDKNVCMKISKHILIWVEEQTYWIALRFLLLGFELELYSPNDYCMVYWYIYVVLIKLAEKSHLKMVTSNDNGEISFQNEVNLLLTVTNKIEYDFLLYTSVMGAFHGLCLINIETGGLFFFVGMWDFFPLISWCFFIWSITCSTFLSKRKGKKKKDSLKDVARDYQIPPMVLLLQCQIYLAEGLTMMLAALRNENKVLQVLGPFNTEQERFIQHFELLQKACIPDHMPYLSFRESTTHARFSTLLMYNYFKDAQKIAKELKSSFSSDPDRLAEVGRIEQVAEHNGIAQNLISRLGTLDPSLKVYFEFNYHPHFATAVVKRS